MAGIKQHVDHTQPDEATFAIEHGHDHDHPEVHHPDGALHHENWGTNHAHDHRWHPTEDHHHPVDPDDEEAADQPALD